MKRSAGHCHWQRRARGRHDRRSRNTGAPGEDAGRGPGADRDIDRWLVIFMAATGLLIAELT